MTDQTTTRAAFRVYGRVQGVGFRWWTHRTAKRLGLTGSVRNLADGTVEVRVKGTDTAIQKLASSLQQGPASARVQRVEREPVEGKDIPRDDFRIER